MTNTDPIFIHSMFRCASTYFFQKFRALGPAFTCYQEPFNESLEALNRPSRHSRLLAPVNPELRHPPLDRPYFYEFWLSRDALRGLFRRAYAYDEYFPGQALPQGQQRWISALIQHAQGRAVLQFCRSTGRAQALRAAFGGTHIHLWREPRAQWWSYKVAAYFDGVTRHIYAAQRLPEPLARLAAGVSAHRSGECAPAPQDNYALFYGLWLHSWLRLQPLADLSISIDRIALIPEDNRACARRLSSLADAAIDLGDIRASGMAFSVEEVDFYRRVEEGVRALFERYRPAGAALLASAEQAAQEVRGAHLQHPHDVTAERNLRQAALSLMSRAAGSHAVEPRRWSLPSGTPERTLLRALRELGRPRTLDANARSAPAPAVSPQGLPDGYHQG